MARMFFHNPQFGLLDECTSAVSIDAEEKLYAAAVAQGITCLTVSQRLSLPQYHDVELQVGQPTELGYATRKITETENLMASAL
eukprot:SAG22_NODE_21890_length_253_cov_0.668831_1_plen_83_part_11